MIFIRLNDEVIKLEKQITLSEFLMEKGYSDQPDQPYAVMLNQRFIPRASYTNLLQDNDLIQIIVPMQGG